MRCLDGGKKTQERGGGRRHLAVQFERKDKKRLGFYFWEESVGGASSETTPTRKIGWAGLEW